MSLSARQRRAIDRILRECDADLGSGACARSVLDNAPWYASEGTIHYDQPHLEALFNLAEGHGGPDDWNLLEGASDADLRAHLTGETAEEPSREPWGIPRRDNVAQLKERLTRIR